MQLSVRLFASVREALGASAIKHLRQLGLGPDPRWRVLQDQSRRGTVVAVPLDEPDDDVLLWLLAALRENDQVAVIPPVSGGSNRHFEITAERLSGDSVAELVRSPECGAITVFLGTARRMSRGREVEYLEYEAYPEMAIRKLDQIADEVQDRWATDRLAVRHRVGRVELGEPSVAIAVATEHRAEGFAACKYTIDRLKEIVPIWKKEVWVGGGEWIGWDCVEDPMEALT